MHFLASEDSAVLKAMQLALNRSDKAKVFGGQVIVKYQQVYIDLWMLEMVQTKTT